MGNNQHPPDKSNFLNETFHKEPETLVENPHELPGAKGKSSINILPVKSDRDKFNTLFRQYYPQLLAYAGIFLDEDSAKDIVQDLMVYLWEKSDQINIHTSLESYLFRAVYQRCLNAIKHKRIKETYSQKKSAFQETEIEFYDPDRNQVIKEIFSKELRKMLDDAIETLPPRCREVFIKSYIEGLHTTEIATALQITERTAETHIYTALKHLRDKLKDKAFILFLLGI